MTHTLQARGLCKSLDAAPALLDHVDLDLQPGAMLAVAAEHTAATTLVRCLSGAYRLDAGTVVLAAGGEHLDLSAASPRDVAWVRRHHLAVLDGPAAASPSQDAAAVVARLAACPPEEARTGLARLGGAELADRRYGTLRGPQRRLVALTAALAGRAPVLLLDAPDDVADPARTAAWLDERRTGGAAVLVTVAAGSPLTTGASASGELHEGKLRWTA